MIDPVPSEPTARPLPPPLDRWPVPDAWSPYLQVTRTATYSFLIALPLLILYEVGILIVNNGSAYGVRIGADVYIKSFLAGLGVTGHLLLGLVVLIIGLVVFFSERKDQIPLRKRYFGWMLAESLGWAVVLATLIGGVVGAVFGAATLPDLMAQIAGRTGTFDQLVLSLGAGLYEELFFRVILVGGLYALLYRALKRPRGQAYWVAAIVGALIFSAVHYIGAYGDPFAFGSFTFRFLFGLALNGLFLVRGFGVAAWTHALYDVLVTVVWS